MRKLLFAGSIALLLGLAGCSTSPAPAGGKLTGTVTEVSQEFGNLDTSITKDAVAAAGMSEGDTLRFACGGPAFDVAYATDYGDVAEGAWVAFINWDDKLRFARNRASAAEAANCKLADTVSVSRAP